MLKLMAAGKLKIRIGYKPPFLLDSIIKGHQLPDSKHADRIIIAK
ncbi:hypothetical protein [Lentilactobacillus otakiensis]